MKYSSIMKKPNALKGSILFVFLFIASYIVQAQNQKVTLPKKQITILSAFEEIEKQTNLNVAYNEATINVNRNISVDIADKTLTEALTAILKGTNVTFRIQGNRIIIVQVPVATQAKKYAGTIIDNKGEPITGAGISLKGSQTGSITDMDGKFTIEAPAGSTLSISYIGYTAQEIKLGENTILQITMQEDQKLLDEVVVVGYGTQRKSTLTGAISTVKSEKLTVAPITNITNTLGGQLAGLTTKQTSGFPGSDDASLMIRGSSNPLVIVDGVEMNFNNLDPSQVETITILKDGSASIYGARAGNGVILVTTKRGLESKSSITLNSSFSWQGSTHILPATNAGQRAEFENEAHRNNGYPESQRPYTDEEVRKFYDGSDPNYPNGDWFGATIRDWAPQQNHNVSVRGGSDKIKYYGYLGYNKQETIIRNDGGDFSRYNLQSNIDAKITDRLTASIDFSFIQRQEFFGKPESHRPLMWEILYNSDPKYPISLPDPDKLSYSGQYAGNPVYYFSSKLGGYSNIQRTAFRSSGALTYDFKYIKGLKAKAFINYNYDVYNYKQMFKEREFYSYNHDSDTYTLARKSLNPTSVERSSSASPSLTQQYSLSYNNVFNKVHNLSAIVVYEAISSSNSGFSAMRSGYSTTVIEELNAGNASTATNSSSSSEMGRASWISRLNYSYQNRYMLEAILRADASARFAPGYRWGYFPSVSLGWVISEEKFMQPFDSLEFLKLRLSEGQSGYDNIGNFDYLNTFGIDKSYIFGDQTISGLYQTRVANPAFTWETMTIYNAGLDFSFWKRKLYGTGEIFYRLRDGILGTRNNSVPSTFGQTLPTENLNSQDTRGFELQLGTAGKTGDFSYDVSGNISWNRSKWVKLDEPEYANADQKRISSRVGRWTDIRYGYISDGLFTSQEEIDALTYYYADLGSNDKIRPGDVKYKNLNGDNKLDWRDQTILGPSNTPHWMYGINTYLRYKNVDLSMLFQGAFGYTSYIRLNTYYTQYGFEHRWTEKNNDPHALNPRLASKSLDLYSDYYVHNTSYIRLKNLSLGFDLPEKQLKKTGIEKARIYVAGTNLLTLSTIDKYGYDPEAPENISYGYYPQQRTFSVGINLSF